MTTRGSRARAERVCGMGNDAGLVLDSGEATEDRRQIAGEKGELRSVVNVSGRSVALGCMDSEAEDQSEDQGQDQVTVKRCKDRKQVVHWAIPFLARQFNCLP
ncbi:MAG: hypothetical protein EA339_09705 [Rhodobacteraceae bacterium]|nr:MAG: hypothetical protein EA339_09705 [Paracoccaceae bacterium]